MTKTLVILIGNSRGSVTAWESLEKLVLQPLNADLALVFGKGEAHNMLYETAKYTKLVDEYEDWGNCLDYIAKKEGITSDWRSILLSDKTINDNTGLWGGVTYNDKNLHGSGSIIFCMRYFVREMIEENSLLDVYDQFIITRSDHYYEFDHENLSTDNIWIPSGEDHSGITDRHIVVDNQNVINTLNIIPWCLKKNTHLLGNPERVLQCFYKEINIFSKIKRFNRSFYTVKTKQDQSRWGGNAAFIEKIGLYSKYPQEYIQTMKNLYSRKSTGVSTMF